MINLMILTEIYENITFSMIFPKKLEILKFHLKSSKYLVQNIGFWPGGAQGHFLVKKCEI